MAAYLAHSQPCDDMQSLCVLCTSASRGKNA